MVKATKLPRRPATAPGPADSSSSTTSPVFSQSFSHLLSRATSVRHLKENSEPERRFERTVEDREGKRKMSHEVTSPGGHHLPNGAATTSPVGSPSTRTATSATPITRHAEIGYRKRPSLSTSHLNGSSSQNGTATHSLTLINSNNSYQSFSSLTPASEAGQPIDASISSTASLVPAVDFEDLKLPPPPAASNSFIKRRGKNHHAYGKAVPYPRSYEKMGVDHDVIDNMWMFTTSHDICQSSFPDGPPKKVLDLGCGTGAWVLLAAEHWKDTGFVGLDLVRIQPDLTLLDPDDATESAKAKLLNQLAQPPSATTALNSGLRDFGAGPVTVPNEDTPGRPTHKSLTVHDKQPKGVGEHASSPSHVVGGRGRSASIPLSTGPLSPATYRSPHLSTGSLMSPLSADSSFSGSTAKFKSEVPRGPTTATTGPTLEALVAALPENALYGGVSNARTRKEDLTPVHHGAGPGTTLGHLKLKQRIKWVHGNFLEPLPFPSGYFDYVRMRRVARGIPEDKWSEFFTEVNRVLRIGGVIEVNESNINFPGGAFPSLTVGNDQANSSPSTSRNRRKADRPAFVGCLKAARPKGVNDDMYESSSPGSPPLISMASAYAPLRDTGPSTFFHNGYGHGYIPPSSSLRSPPRGSGRPSSADPPRPSLMESKLPSTTGLSVAPTAIFDDPRDHTILESIYLSLHESRFINLQPLFIIPEYLGSVFGQVKSHPLSMFLAPDRKIDGPGLAGGRKDPTDGTPMLNGVIDSVSLRAFTARLMGLKAPALGLHSDEGVPSDPNTQARHYRKFGLNMPDEGATPSATAIEDLQKHQAAARPSKSSEKLSSSSSRPRTSDTSLPRRQFIEDYMAFDPARAEADKGSHEPDDVWSQASTGRGKRVFEYDVDFSGLLLSIEVAGVLSCVEEMWEHARAMDSEALRPVFDEKVMQYAVDMRNRIQMESTLEKRLHWEGRNKGQSELQKEFEARLQQVLTQEEELVADEEAMVSDEDATTTATPSSKAKASQDKPRRMTSSSTSATPLVTSSRRKLQRVIDGEYENYANGRIISRTVRVWSAVKEEHYEQLKEEDLDWRKG
ncbi:hypothetical protein FRB96_005829 [Tulasnella sp. 330]|nr:hypothetical protein FRB96_005829 [Tulasnella sp. 330]KAG8881079.1 hypothetical protein FRB97_000198 [Tulasnella sp. 331]KAG8888625.1 hypothetical protein FRB98_007298 [Tulasnella sp. 332]